jgi:valyl-tRNA synthetase
MAALEGRYDFKTAEPRLQQFWSDEGVYEFNLESGGPPYTVDTPPPTVSGKIHVGHVYSYTHADVVIRYHRMRGDQVLYPFGFDDNGLPTEIFVENTLGIRAIDVGRQKFIEECLKLSSQVEDEFERFWKRLGLSVDWRLRYSTIDPRSRRVSQSAFLDLQEKGNVYRQEAPSLWCPRCRTGVAQADVDDKPGVKALFSTIPFSVDGGVIPIATTRPELLAACVAVFVHPSDQRYQSLIGKTARTPVFHLEVPILGDPKADPEKGTGAVMCCTFGDVTDVAWWREHGLPLRLAITPDGRMNEVAGDYTGLSIKQMRAKMLEELAASGQILEQREIEHTVGVHERCGTDLEYLVTKQWFIKLLDKKQLWIDSGRRIKWHPEYMRTRYENWVEGLTWDWNISRQKYYGVPFPVWYCTGCGEPVLARREDLPVDPNEQGPPSDVCTKCGGREFEPEVDVMDTWATSSVTPQLCGTLLQFLGISEAEFDQRFRPMTLRPNAHDIIRTWDFYTIVRSLYLTGDIPWTNVLISGHALDPSGKKISKSKLKGADHPTPMLEQFSADAVRYWATSVRTGGDTNLSEEVFRNGSRLVTKLWNAAKFGLSLMQDYHPSAEPPDGLNATDRWLLARLAQVIRRATQSMEDYEFATAKAEVERFFWADLADNYIEMVKARLYGDAGGAGQNGQAGRAAGQYTLYHAVLSVVKILAPFMPHIAEEVYQQGFASTDGAVSVHIARWPEAHASWGDAEAERIGQAILEVAEGVRRWKSDRKVSVGAPVTHLTVTCPENVRQALEDAVVDLRSVTRAEAIAFQTDGEAVSVDIRAEQTAG